MAWPVLADGDRACLCTLAKTFCHASEHVSQALVLETQEAVDLHRKRGFESTSAAPSTPATESTTRAHGGAARTEHKDPELPKDLVANDETERVPTSREPKGDERDDQQAAAAAAELRRKKEEAAALTESLQTIAMHLVRSAVVQRERAARGVPKTPPIFFPLLFFLVCTFSFFQTMLFPSFFVKQVMVTCVEEKVKGSAFFPHSYGLFSTRFGLEIGNGDAERSLVSSHNSVLSLSFLVRSLQALDPPPILPDPITVGEIPSAVR